jgi:hypothetical protein
LFIYRQCLKTNFIMCKIWGRRGRDYETTYSEMCRSQWPRSLRRRSAAARLLKFLVLTPPEAWMPVSCECCVLWGRGFCDDLATHSSASYRVSCVTVCDLETSWMRRPRPALGRSPTGGGGRYYEKLQYVISVLKRETFPSLCKAGKFVPDYIITHSKTDYLLSIIRRRNT